MYELEEEMGLQAEQKPLFVLYQSLGESNWRVQAIATGPDSFASRNPLPES